MPRKKINQEDPGSTEEVLAVIDWPAPSESSAEEVNNVVPDNSAEAEEPIFVDTYIPRRSLFRPHLR